MSANRKHTCQTSPVSYPLECQEYELYAIVAHESVGFLYTSGTSSDCPIGLLLVLEKKK